MVLCRCISLPAQTRRTGRPVTDDRRASALTTRHQKVTGSGAYVFCTVTHSLQHSTFTFPTTLTHSQRSLLHNPDA